MITISDQHLVDILYNYFLDLDGKMLYYRWDTYLTSKGFINEYLTMMYKTSDQQERILALAREKANTVKGTKLWKTLK